MSNGPATRDKLLRITRAALRGLASGAELRLPDLVPEEVWTAAPMGARLSAGMAFKTAMDVESKAECLSRDPTNHQGYRRTAS